MISLIVAKSENGVIGLNGKLPWYLPEDLRLFKEITYGKNIVMGRKTYESLPKRPLPGRNNIVLSSSGDCDGIKVYGSIDDLLTSEKDFIVCGGQSIYQNLMPFIEEFHISEVNGTYEGDTFFPALPANLVLQDKKVYEGFSYFKYKKC